MSTYITVLLCITIGMVQDRIGVESLVGRDMIEGYETTQVLADNGPTFYIRPCKDSITPLRLPYYELGVFYALEIRLGSVNTVLPGALVQGQDLVHGS